MKGHTFFKIGDNLELLKICLYLKKKFFSETLLLEKVLKYCGFMFVYIMILALGVAWGQQLGSNIYKRIYEKQSLKIDIYSKPESFKLREINIG